MGNLKVLVVCSNSSLFLLFVVTLFCSGYFRLKSVSNFLTPSAVMDHGWFVCFFHGFSCFRHIYVLVVRQTEENKHQIWPWDDFGMVGVTWSRVVAQWLLFLVPFLYLACHVIELLQSIQDRPMFCGCQEFKALRNQLEIKPTCFIIFVGHSNSRWTLTGASPRWQKPSPTFVRKRISARCPWALEMRGEKPKAGDEATKW